MGEREMTMLLEAAWTSFFVDSPRFLPLGRSMVFPSSFFSFSFSYSSCFSILLKKLTKVFKNIQIIE
jgi:hypothetical protein